MTVVYLDRQIVIDHLVRSEIIAAVESWRSRGAVFPYSPAHIEEIAKAHRVGRGAPMQEQISHVEELSGGLALMPAVDGPAELRQEDIRDCLARVMDDGGSELTQVAVDWERRRIGSYTDSDSDKFMSKTRRAVQKLGHDRVFSEPHVLQHLGRLAGESGFQIRTATFLERQDTMSTLFDVLNVFGFAPEHADRHIENRVHDVSHAIYASYADVFVTNDKKLNRSSKAVYGHCRIDVKVLDRHQFTNAR